MEQGNVGKSAIVLIPVGPVSPDLLTWLEQRLAEVLGWDVTIGEGIPLPDDGYDPRRRQYLGEVILDALHAFSYPPTERLLGLTEADCYTPGLNFVFGQAALNGREAFVALPCLRSLFYGLAEDLDLYRRRALKEVVHELGHTWGLRHCRDSRGWTPMARESSSVCAALTGCRTRSKGRSTILS